MSQDERGAMIEGGVVAGLVAVVAGIFAGLGALLRGYWPHRLQMEKLALAESRKREAAAAIIIQQLTNSLEGVFILLDECHLDHEDQQRVNIMFYSFMERQNDALKSSSTKKEDLPKLPDMPPPRRRNVEALSRARYLMGEGRQALVMLNDSFRVEGKKDAQARSDAG